MRRMQIWSNQAVYEIPLLDFIIREKFIFKTTDFPREVCSTPGMWSSLSSKTSVLGKAAGSSRRKECTLNKAHGSAMEHAAWNCVFKRQKCSLHEDLNTGWENYWGCIFLFKLNLERRAGEWGRQHCSKPSPALTDHIIISVMEC